MAILDSDVACYLAGYDNYDAVLGNVKRSGFGAPIGIGSVLADMMEDM